MTRLSSAAVLIVILVCGCTHGADRRAFDLAASANGIEGLSYSAARAALMDSGWRPRVTSMEGPFGPEREWLSAGFFLRLGYVEVQQCAGTGDDPCLFNFTGPHGECLQVGTAGEREAATVVSARRQCPD